MASVEGMLKAIYVNGILVGHVPATGDQERDIEAVRAFMKERGLVPPNNPFRPIRGLAHAFASASNAVYERYLRGKAGERNGLAAVPFVVNSAFSIELYLKTLLQVHGTPKKVHSLLTLYDALPADTRATIERVAVSFAPNYLQPEQLAKPFVFRDVITTLDNAFVEWRYAYELGRTPLVEIHPTIIVMATLHKVCQDVVAQHDAPLVAGVDPTT
jgi:hypothetical protein